MERSGSEKVLMFVIELTLVVEPTPKTPLGLLPMHWVFAPLYITQVPCLPDSISTGICELMSSITPNPSVCEGILSDHGSIISVNSISTCVVMIPDGIENSTSTVMLPG